MAVACKVCGWPFVMGPNPQQCSFHERVADRAALAQAGELVAELIATADSLPEVKYAADMDAILLREAAATLVAQQARIAALEAALADIMDYRGGADSALEDEYVMDRARAALATGDKP